MEFDYELDTDISAGEFYHIDAVQTKEVNVLVGVHTGCYTANIQKSDASNISIGWAIMVAVLFIVIAIVVFKKSLFVY